MNNHSKPLSRNLLSLAALMLGAGALGAAPANAAEVHPVNPAADKDAPHSVAIGAPHGEQPAAPQKPEDVGTPAAKQTQAPGAPAPVVAVNEATQELETPHAPAQTLPAPQRQHPQPSLPDRLAGPPSKALEDVPGGRFIYRDPMAERAQALRTGEMSTQQIQHYKELADALALSNPEAAAELRQSLQQVNYQQHQDYWVNTGNPDVPPPGNLLAPAAVVVNSAVEAAK